MTLGDLSILNIFFLVPEPSFGNDGLLLNLAQSTKQHPCSQAFEILTSCPWPGLYMLFLVGWLARSSLLSVLGSYSNKLKLGTVVGLIPGTVLESGHLVYHLSSSNDRTSTQTGNTQSQRFRGNHRPVSKNSRSQSTTSF